MLDDGTIISFSIARYDRRNQREHAHYLCVLFLSCVGKDFVLLSWFAMNCKLYPPTFIIPIDTHYISTEKRTAIASDVWFFAICSTKRAVSCLPHCKMNCILAGGFAVSVQQYQFLCKLSGAMTSVTNIHHFSDNDVRQGLRISFGWLGFAHHDQPSAPAFAICNTHTQHKQKTKQKQGHKLLRLLR